MTKQEFTDRTGYTPDDQEFAKIHSTYMQTVLDKDEFCEDWKNHNTSKIIESLHVVAVNRELRLELLERERHVMVDFLLSEAQAWGIRRSQKQGHRNGGPRRSDPPPV